jgi:hypothetical protein
MTTNKSHRATALWDFLLLAEVINLLYKYQRVSVIQWSSFSSLLINGWVKEYNESIH